MEKEIKEEVKVETPVDDESALDKELEASISAVKAGNVLEEKTPVKTEEKEPAKEPETKVEEPAKPQVDDETKEKKYDYRIPNKGKFESDESYEKRVELLDLVQKRKLAKSDDQRQQLSDQINKTKSQLGALNGTDKNINPLNTKAEVDTKKEEVDEVLAADRERLKQLGGATKDDIQEIIQKERMASEVKGTLEKFVDRHEELKDADAREVFFDFVDSNFNWQGKTGKELMTVLELARESMFKPSESIQERVIKAANVQEKVNAMQFPGGSVAKQDFSPEMKKSIEELKSAGYSEEKAIELLSD